MVLGNWDCDIKHILPVLIFDKADIYRTIYVFMLSDKNHDQDTAAQKTTLLTLSLSPLYHTDHIPEPYISLQGFLCSHARFSQA